ncbi:HAMP domain-containing histidine kinase [Candidatus Gracilibacteria bacterium]|nr:HAMP domain-containing histidine kinase [Candidatus Gracilibacteria bacterium]NUJ99213.1 HAMP domain-containing histidine kinase [Candidatus Gracilibacteria bacterium]
MNLSRKFIIIIVSSILFIAIVNVGAFYFFYNSYIKIYLAEKIKYRDEISIDYINDIIEKQTIDDIDNIFSDVEIEFFELLGNNEGKIPLNKEENRDVIINYLIKSGVTPKYIEEILPTNNFQKVLDSLKNKNSPEYNFLTKLTWSIVIINILSIVWIIIIIFLFTKKTILPIKEVTNQIKNLNFGKANQEISYNKKDEIGLLINAINGLNKRLSVQENIRTRLLADISHELKTPITSIQCYLEGISDGVIKLDGKTLPSLTEEMKRLINLVNKIMDYEKFDNKKLEVNLQEENVSDILKLIVETHKKRLKENHQRIKITGENIIIPIDKDLFKQLAHNLIGNFLKYAGKESLLTINITKKYIDFSDNGAGVKQSEIPYLMEKFYQGNIEKTGNIEERGIGIGLSIVGKILDVHNWKYQIKSDEKKGFSFKIIL